jgi:hypothetical protein
LLLGIESAENPHSGTMNTVSMKKPFASNEKPPSFGILINTRQPVITPDAPPVNNKNLYRKEADLWA